MNINHSIVVIESSAQTQQVPQRLIKVQRFIFLPEHKPHEAALQFL